MVCLVIAMLAPVSIAAQSWDEVVDGAVRLPFDDWGIASGEVADGHAAFVFDVSHPGPLTIEVLVTEIREGIAYTDADSVLFLFDESGLLLDYNDDGPYGLESLLNGTSIEEPGTYVAIVTTHPRFAMTDERGYFAGFDEPGLSSIAFDLVVEGGARDLPDDFHLDGPFFDLDDVYRAAVPVTYAGRPVLVSGAVAEGIAVYEVLVDDPERADIEVEITTEYRGRDSVLTVLDADGYFVAFDDDGGVDTASFIEYADLTTSSVYYVIVTSWPNMPEFDESDRLIGFTGIGESDFAFNLIISPGPAQ